MVFVLPDKSFHTVFIALKILKTFNDVILRNFFVQKRILYIGVYRLCIVLLAQEVNQLPYFLSYLLHLIDRNPCPKIRITNFAQGLFFGCDNWHIPLPK